MCKSIDSRRILVLLTGSIAAYKVATLISRLVRDGHEIQTVATISALEFVGEATLEGLTGNRVLSDTFASGEMMSHIDLAKWADLVLLAPATADTLNKAAAGIADNLVSSLLLAIPAETPIVAAPAMNTRMLQHPATQASLATIAERGVHVLPTAEGFLACGDEGPGKMLEPEAIWEHLQAFLACDRGRGMRILITGGATSEPLDPVRSLTNLSTGRTAASLADAFLSRGHSVRYLHGRGALLPGPSASTTEFSDAASLEKILAADIEAERYDLVLHAAAVSDWRPVTWRTGKVVLALPTTEKISSQGDSAVLELVANPKIIRMLARDLPPDTTLVAFKFTVGADEQQVSRAVATLQADIGVTLVVHNDARNREHETQQNFTIYGAGPKPISARTADDLATTLLGLIQKRAEAKNDLVP
jgi:phosphopantothenoylcysteine decarboxylase/phosphopantothenate--cysteine ligase